MGLKRRFNNKSTYSFTVAVVGNFVKYLFFIALTQNINHLWFGVFVELISNVIS
jgi:hypothetical protein